MSKTSYFLIGLMIAALAFLAALRGYQAYERRTAAAEEAGRSALTFQNVPINFAPQMQPAPVVRKMPLPGEEPREIYLDEAPLSSDLQLEQARRTVASILEGYKNNTALQRFNRDLRAAAAGEQVDLTVLSGPDLPALMLRYPQLQTVIVEHAKDPEFVKVTQEIFSNPQYVQSVALLQRASQVQHAIGKN